MGLDETKFVAYMNYNIVALDSWIDIKRLSDGSYRLIGMGRHIERDATTGIVVSDKTEPTGLVGTAPHDAFGERRTMRQWLRGTVAWMSDLLCA